MKTARLVLAGNPNVGKSVLFNALTGRYADVSNFPGTTVEVMHGSWRGYIVLDTPGIYGLGMHNEEERVALAVIQEADVVLNVIDAAHLERDLFLTLQLIDAGFTLVIGVNLMDEADRLGRTLDLAMLEERLGIAVFPLALTDHQRGLPSLLRGLEQGAARQGYCDLDLRKSVTKQAGNRSSLCEALLTLEESAARESIYRLRRERADAIAAAVVHDVQKQASFADCLSRFMLSPWTGFPLLVAFLGLFYYLIGVVVAQEVTYYTESILFQQWIVPWLRRIVAAFLDPQSWSATLLIGEYGLLTMALSYLGGLLLPLVIAFYLILSFLEDSGYLPRLATLVDRQLRLLGINGRGIIPLILGFGCVTMAGIATRILGSDRERSIAVFLLGLTIPCSAQLGILMSLSTILGAHFSLIYLLLLFTIFLTSGFLLDRLLPGEPSPLLIDLPTLRWPRFGNLMQKTSLKTVHFMQDAVPLFVLGSVLISILQLSGGLDLLIAWLTPLTVSWLRLPPQSATVFILGMIRRDFGAAGLLGLHLGPEQTLVAMVVITLFVPCLASLLVFWKERGPKETISLWLLSIILAFALGGGLAAVLL